MARTYLVIDPVRHDGQDYAPGGTIELDAKAAGALLAVGAIAHDAQPRAPVVPIGAKGGKGKGGAPEGDA